MLEKIKAFRSLLTKDVENENEVKMYAVIMRITLVYFSIYCDLGAVFAGVHGHIGPCIYMIVESVIAVWLIAATYNNKTMAVQYCATLLLTVHITIHSLYYGVDTNLMQLSYVIIMLIFATDYMSKMWIKISCLIGILLYRMGLYALCEARGPVFDLDNPSITFWQFIHMILVSCTVASVVIISTSDFTEMRKKLTVTNTRLRDVAGKDPLTALPNRRSMLDFIHRCIADYENGSISAMTMVMADVDLFKKVNDTYGHENGDIVLTDLANIMGAFMRGKGLASRWGGEEFVLVFVDKNGDEVYQMLSDLQKEIAGLCYHWNDTDVHITLTYGVAEQGSGATAEETIKEADEKLYIGKERGRNIVIF